MASSTSSSSIRKSTTSASSLFTSESTSAEPLYQVKLLNALRTGDPALIHPFLAEIGKEKRKSADQRNGSGNTLSRGSSENDPNSIDTGAAALHLAIRCASLETVTLLLSHRAISPVGVHPPGTGTTALHLAAALGRADVVDRLLEQETVDDTLQDREGRTARDVARGKDVIRVFDDSRTFLNASYRSLLRSYILSPMPSASFSSSPNPQAAVGPPPALISMLSSPRAAHLDLSYIDDASGRTLLHEAARRRDLRLLELAVRAGADVFVRDRRGKLPGEESSGDGRSGARGGKGNGDVKAFLRQLTNQDAALIRSEQQSAPIHAPSMRGFLNKYTNVAKGYNTRWFVLENGVLSYYRHQEDEVFASRGSIAVVNCVLKPPSGTDRLRFEIHSGSGKGGEKWYLKANHPIEAGRWVSAVAASVAWAKARAGEDSESIDGRPSNAGVMGSGASIMSNSSAGSRTRVVSVLRRSGTGTMSSATGSRPSRSHTGEADSLTSEPGGRTSGEGSPKLGESDAERDGDVEEEPSDDDEDPDSSASVSLNGKRGVAAPHEDTFELLGNSATTQLELILGLVGGNTGAQDALRDALSTVTEFVAVAKERDAWWRKKLARSRAKATAWENSLASSVREAETLEQELRLRSRKRGSRFFDANEVQAALAGGSTGGTLKARQKRMSMLATTVAEDDRLVESPPAHKQEFDSPFQEPAAVAVRQPTAPLVVASPPPFPPVRSSTAETLSPATATASTFGQRGYVNHADTESMIDTDEEDEFFDAIESNTIPNLVVADGLKSPAHSEMELPNSINVKPYEGYKQLREKLLLTNERPSTSLWSVLKHSIGKDLTKISFPVFFNEPTSMLQRMAEDMEFSECLDVAAKERDPHRRIAFPFNPMLSETFEYVRIDKEYRYLSEQVSHHPPISACMAESPYWRYFGEVDAQNKFMGKSFEIRPTGRAHAELLLPKEFAPSYPRGQAPFESKVKEHFSWKKVTTNVSGFILGAPTIDHYGDMTITNHRTGDTCVLTFKPRGWRGKDAFEISGYVQDARGQVTYEIAGRWNSQLIARQVGAGTGALNPDLTVGGQINSPSSTPEYILLWRNSDKPVGSPFNLTPFAITLNNCPKDTLKPYLCPTDCRLRPDQRAFEMGEYETANGLKNDQEEFQRATRKRRETGEIPAHRPRWFTAETDGDAGDRVWTPTRNADGAMEYWAEREAVWKAGGTAKKGWTGVDPIFIQEPDFMR
ncbi:Oxysterol-binding protein [Mycena indigotica]|uniref:Oxysterol-binding protein n=1 Tax=Mycena indigotica TaxID=2126181 RepID=A0A8H6SQJ1_9AGAR|nr:Oxysterol-binding protein [Mycena indigotica]KAF7303589.1 Oxysterol-binding protein [Mycena indigotica]